MLFLLLLACVAALDTNFYKACWNVTLTDDSLFCHGAIGTPIDEDTFYNATTYDAEAKRIYRGLLAKWSNRENP